MDQAIVYSVRGERGITLTELVVTLALFGMIMVGVLGVWIKTQETYFVGSDTAEIQQNVRSAIDFMVREMRAAGRDVTVCGFDYSGGTALDDCTGTKPATCAAKIGAGYVSCTGRFAIPQATANLIQIRADRNDNGTIAIAGNGDSQDEDVIYALSPPAAPPPGGCPVGGSCIVRTAGGVSTSMVAVDISGLQFIYYPRPGFPPCSNVPPQNPCPPFVGVPIDQYNRDNIGMVRISVTAQSTVGGQTVLRTLTTDVILKNRFSN